MAFRPFIVGIVSSTAVLSVTAIHNPAYAQAGTREAQIVVDAETNEILYENNAQAARRPASITKVMTLYLLFDALKKGSITWDDRISFSRNAANQPPTKLFVGAGNSIPVQTAVEALVLRSANDVATAVAERLGGSESNFAQMMTSKARELGMSSTTFRNASGLPNATQRTTAEDLARLAIAIHRDFPEQYHWFSAQQMSWNGQIINGHNHLMGRMQGMDGLKTGYTNASGFNLAATTQRNGRRVVTVVLGGANRFQRDDLVEALTESAFRELGINATQFASNTTSYEVNFRDARDAADAAALFMDLPPRPITSSGMTTIAMARSGRRLGFERGAPTFQVADMTRRPEASRVIIGRGTQLAQREDSEASATDEGEDEVTRPVSSPTPTAVPFRVAVAPSATPTPVRVMPTPAPAATPTRVPVIFPSTAQYPQAVPVPTPVPASTTLRQMAQVAPAQAATSTQQVSLTSTPYALRGTLGSPTASEASPTSAAPDASPARTEAAPTQIAELLAEKVPSVVQEPQLAVAEEASKTEPSDTPKVQVAEASPTQVLEVQAPKPTQMAELAEKDAAALATDTPPPAQTGELNGSINLAEATPAPTAQSEAAPTTKPTDMASIQMATLDSEAVAQAQRRQAEANLREQARLAEAQALEATRREAARVQAAAAARAIAERQANERRAARDLAEARLKVQKEKEVRELAQATAAAAAAERQAEQERAVAAREEERRQAEAARARNARGNAIVQVGAFKDKADANAAISQFARYFPSFAQREVSTVSRRDGIWYRARFAGLGALAASEACRLVSGRGGACQIVGD
jgi:D-alanyl-D-alanine carboxypeptidase